MDYIFDRRPLEISDGDYKDSILVTEGKDLSDKWNLMQNSAKKYNNNKYKYDVYQQNCHTFVGTILRENNLSIPKSNYFTPAIDYGFKYGFTI
jgi:hypothetical protein